MKSGFLLAFIGFIASPAAALDTAALIERGDSLYSTRTETTGTREALSSYEQAIAQSPDSVEAKWKACRALFWLADHATNKKEKLELFERGIKIGEQAVSADPKSVDAHFWLGGLYGSYGEARGVLKSLALVKPIRREMGAINELDDHYQGGAGYRVLGIVDYKVPGFAGGSKKRARENLKKAVGIDPTNAFNQYYLAEFLDAVGERKNALDQLKVLADTKVNVDVDAQDLKMMKERGEKLRKKLER